MHPPPTGRRLRKPEVYRLAYMYMYSWVNIMTLLAVRLVMSTLLNSTLVILWLTSQANHNFPDFSLTNVEFPDFSRLSSWMSTLEKCQFVAYTTESKSDGATCIRRITARLYPVHTADATQLSSWVASAVCTQFATSRRQSRRVWANLPTEKSSCVVSAMWTHLSAVVAQYLLCCWAIEVGNKWRRCWKSHHYSRSKFT